MLKVLSRFAVCCSQLGVGSHRQNALQLLVLSSMAHGLVDRVANVRSSGSRIRLEKRALSGGRERPGLVVSLPMAGARCLSLKLLLCLANLKSAYLRKISREPAESIQRLSAWSWPAVHLLHPKGAFRYRCGFPALCFHPTFQQISLTIYTGCPRPPSEPISAQHNCLTLRRPLLPTYLLFVFRRSSSKVPVRPVQLSAGLAQRRWLAALHLLQT